MEDLKKIIERLDELGTKLYKDLGSRSYTYRCVLHDIKADILKINFIDSSLPLNEKNKTSIVGFENYIAKVHPDPDSVLIDNMERWKQIVLLAENYAKQ